MPPTTTCGPRGLLLNRRNLITGRYTRGRPFQQQPRVSTFNPRDFNGKTEAVTAAFTHTRTIFSSETRFGYNKNDVRRLDGIYDTGVPGIVGNLGFGFSGETLFKGGSTTSIEEVLALTRGRHSIRLVASSCGSRPVEIISNHRKYDIST